MLADDRAGFAPTYAAALAETSAAPPPGAPAGGTVPPGAPVSLPAPQDAVARDAAADLLAALEALRAAKAAGDVVAEGEALTAVGDAARRFEDAAGTD